MPPRHIADLAGTRRSQFRIKPDAVPSSPSSGYHQTGELHMDSDGVMWICRTSGTPGTWERVETIVTGTIVSAGAGLQVLDSLAIASYRTVKWALECTKPSESKVLVREIVATHNGTLVSDQRPVSFQIGNGNFNIDINVDISGGNIRLTVTPNSTGWTLKWRRLFSMSV